MFGHQPQAVVLFAPPITALQPCRRMIAQNGDQLGILYLSRRAVDHCFVRVEKSVDGKRVASVAAAA